MNMNNQKAIVFLLSFIFVLSTFSGVVSATMGGTNPGSDVFAVINDTSLNYTTFHNNSTHIHSEKFTKEALPTSNLANKPTDQQFKKQKEGLENLRTISTKGLPPKRPDELVAINIERMHSMIKTAKTKITRISSSFYKKIFK